MWQFRKCCQEVPGVIATSLKRRVRGEVEVNAKIGRPSSSTVGDCADVRQWSGDGVKISERKPSVVKKYP